MSEEESVSTKIGRLPTFDGDESKFQVWWFKFMSYATAHKFKQCLKVEREEYLPEKESEVIDVSTEEGKLMKAAKDRNETAMASFAMAFIGDKAMNFVFKACTMEYPEGLAHLVVKNLMKKYRPNDTVSKVELRQKMNQVKMKKGEDPATLFQQICAIETQYKGPGQHLDEGDLIAVILDAAPEEYQAILTSKQDMMGDDLTVADLEEVMSRHYRQLKRLKGSNKGSDENEIALSAFGGQCYKCKKTGHKANKCPEKDSKSTSDGKKDGTNKFTGKCANCGKVGHKAADCWEKEENRSKRPKGYKTATERSNSNEKGASAVDGEGPKIEFLLCSMGFPTDIAFLNDPNVWIADSAATVHMTPHRNGLVNIRKAGKSDSITMGNGKEEKATEIADIGGMICDRQGREVGSARLRDVTVLPSGKYNLFSVTQMMKKGWKLQGDKTVIKLTNGTQELNFDIRIPTPKGVLFAMYLKRDGESVCAGKDGAPKTTKLTAIEAHDKLGHMSDASMRQTAKELNWTITGSDKPCEACAIGKAKQKNVPKSSEHKVATVNGQRIFLDIASVRQTEKSPNTTKPYWRIIVDERTQLKFSDFYETKSGMVEPTCELLNRWMQNGKTVKFLRCDDGGENKTLEKRLHSDAWKLNIEFEYTGRDTPQRNHLAELGFSVLANRGRAIMARAHVPEEIRYLLWREAFKTATLLDGLTVIELEGKKATRYVHWNGSNPEFSNYLRTWGEAGTVKLKTLMTPKISDRGATCMMVGYALNHPGDTYRMWDPTTKRVHVTRDIIWLRRMFYPMLSGMHTATGTIPPVIDVTVPVPSTKDEEGETRIENDDDERLPDEAQNEDNEPEIAAKDSDENNEGDRRNENANWTTIDNKRRSTRFGRNVQPPTRLIEEMNAIAVANYYAALEDDEDDEDFEEFGLVGAGLGGGFDATTELHVLKYKQAMQTKDKNDWIKAVDEEHDRMVKHDVWEPVRKDQVTKKGKVLTTTWAMKKKANGKFRARLNARGFEQIDGVHYDADTKAAPVTNETTIRIVLILMAMAQWCAHVIDVQGAFLNGRFDDGEELYMHVPEGFEKHYKGDVVLKLKRTIYGLKQAAYAFWKELLQAFKSMNFSRSDADPCLYYRWHLNELTLWLSWVDDCLVVGRKENVLKYKHDMMDRFDCDDIGELKEYIGCKVEHDPESRTIKMTQPVLLQSFRDEFGAKDIQHETPAVAGEVLRKGDPEDCMDIPRMKRYRSGVGKLLHLTKWTRPDIQNIVRELSRYMTRALTAHEVAMKRVMEYCLHTEKRGINLSPEGTWDGMDRTREFCITGYSDSDYAKCPDTRRSVSGYTTFLDGALVTAKSKMQECVTLSVTEAELVAATNCVQDMLYIRKIIESIGLKVKLPMTLHVDNKGAKDLMNNWSVGGRTRHVEVRYHFLRELKEKNIVRINWISTHANCADLFTKNLAGPVFTKHITKLCGIDEYMPAGLFQEEGVRIGNEIDRRPDGASGKPALMMSTKGVVGLVGLDSDFQGEILSHKLDQFGNLRKAHGLPQKEEESKQPDQERHISVFI